MKNFLRKFGRHFAIERFGIVFLTLVIAMSFVVGSITVKKVRADRKTLSGNAIYTRNFVMSQTRTTGSLVSLHVNKEHTKVFMLLKFSDMAKMPDNANNYRLFLSGCDAGKSYEKLQCNPTGIIYLFGTSGYLGIYLQDAAGFPNQLLNLYIRADNFTGEKATGYVDATFNDYNQCQIYFNPGGTYARVASFLDRSDWTMYDMVEETMIRSKEAAIRSTLMSDLNEMLRQQLYIDEYSRRLESLGVYVPELPEVLRGDSIYAVAKTGKIAEEYANSRLHYIVEYGGGWVTDDGKAGVRNDDAIVYYDSPFVVTGGFNFNWQDGRIQTGYLKSLTGSSDINRWLDYVTGIPASSWVIDWASTVWTLKDGSEVDMNALNSQVATQREKDIVSTIQLYQKAVDSYYEYKVKYQATDLRALLTLEIDSNTLLTGYTVNSGEKVAVVTPW